MSVQIPEIAKILRVLETYNGRDKSLRTIYFALIIWSTKIRNAEFAQRILALAKQLSLTRLVLRQLNHLPLLVVLSRTRNDLEHAKDKIDVGLNSIVTAIYTVQVFVEFSAWIADAKLIGLDAVRWFRWSL